MRIIRLLAVILVGVVALAAVAHGLGGFSATVTQPIVFNHKVHLEEASLQCADCHTDAASQVWAGLPNKDSCLDCHDVDDEETQNDPEKAKLIRYDDQEQDIPWRRVAVTRPDIFFSHRRHVTAAGLDCLTCHPNQRKLTAPPRTADFVMRMGDCIACHEKSKVTTDCLACHR